MLLLFLKSLHALLKRWTMRTTAYRTPKQMTAKDSNETRILTRRSDF